MYITKINSFSCKQISLYYSCVMFSLLPLRIFYFSCYFEVYLGFKLECIKKKLPKFFQSILCRMDKWNLFLSTNVLLFDVLTILIHHFVLLFSILKKRSFVSKGKRILSQAAWFFFRFLCWMYTYLKSLMIYQSGITMNIRNT